MGCSCKRLRVVRTSNRAHANVCCHKTTWAIYVAHYFRSYSSSSLTMYSFVPPETRPCTLASFTSPAITVVFSPYCLQLTAFFRHHYSLSSFAVCTHTLTWVERALTCVRIQTHRSHAHACNLTCDLYCKLCTESRRGQ